MHIISHSRIAVNRVSEKFRKVVVAEAGDVFVQITSKPHVLLLSLDEEKIIFFVTGGNAGSMMLIHGVSTRNERKNLWKYCFLRCSSSLVEANERPKKLIRWTRKCFH